MTGDDDLVEIGWTVAVDEDHRDVVLSEGDLVVHSARSIPGNEKSIGRMVNHLLRRGARVVTGDDAPIHGAGNISRLPLHLRHRVGFEQFPLDRVFNGTFRNPFPRAQHKPHLM
jgi:ribonuclease J